MNNGVARLFFFILTAIRKACDIQLMPQPPYYIIQFYMLVILSVEMVNYIFNAPL